MHFLQYILLYPDINYIITCKIKKAPKIGAYKRGVPRQWFTGAIIMKKFMCNEEHYNVCFV